MLTTIDTTENNTATINKIAIIFILSTAFKSKFQSSLTLTYFSSFKTLETVFNELLIFGKCSSLNYLIASVLFIIEKRMFGMT